jgi:hypothetical protein
MNGTNLVEVALNTTQPKKNTLNLKYPKSSPGSVYGCRVDWEGVQGIMLAAWLWTTVGNVFGEYNSHWVLKTCFVDLEKKSNRIVAATKD